MMRTVERYQNFTIRQLDQFDKPKSIDRERGRSGRPLPPIFYVVNEDLLKGEDGVAGLARAIINRDPFKTLQEAATSIGFRVLGQVVDKSGDFVIYKAPDGYLVVDKILLAEKGPAAAVVGEPYMTLAAARSAVGRVVPDNNTDKTKPKAAYSEFSGPAAVRRGSKK